MAMLTKILFSDDEEMEQRHIARVKREIESLKEDLQLREEKIKKLKQK